MNKPFACDYESDTLIWLETQIELLRTRRFDLLDLDNLIDELDSMAKHDRRSVAHRLENVIMHLLKCQVQPDHITGSWLGTIREQRYQLGLSAVNEEPAHPLRHRWQLRNAVARTFARD